jgi:hypothetical protein
MKELPESPRHMKNDEAEKIWSILRARVIAYQPDEIVAVSRSGFAYGAWLAQELKLPLGAYWPDMKELAIHPKTKRIVMVDDNTVNGKTYLQTKEFMDNEFPEIDWQFAVFFADWYTPSEIIDNIIIGTKLPYFALEPMWGSRKTSQGYGVRYRDEDTI